MSKVFLGYDQKALDEQYDQRFWVPHAEEIIRRYSTGSDRVREKLGEPRIERYGPHPRETLDIYGSGKKAFVFVHGGAWRRQSSYEQAFPAATIVDAGAAYVALNFALLPAVTLPEMVAQVCRGIEWVKNNLSDFVVLCGHSSGAHLAACALTKLDFLRKALVVSGVYDLLPVRLSSRNDYVRIDERLEQEYSPLRHVDRIRCPVIVAWGEKEAPEFVRQSKDLALALEKQNLLSGTMQAENLNHFEIIETLADPRSPLGRAALNMLQ